LCADGSGNHHHGLFGRCTPPGPVWLQLALPLNLPWHHRTPSTFLAAPTIRVALRSQNHAVFRRESFVLCVRLGSRFLPLPDPLHLSAEKASRSAASSDVSCRPNRCRRASTLAGWLCSSSEESPHNRCPGQDRSSRMPVKAHEAHDPRRLRLAPSRPLSRKWPLIHSTRAGYLSNRNTLSQSAATRLSR
jgi:hypothetical protein